MKLAVLDGDRAAIVIDEVVYDVTDHLPTRAGRYGGPWLPWLEEGGAIAQLQHRRIAIRIASHEDGRVAALHRFARSSPCRRFAWRFRCRGRARSWPPR